MNVITKTDEWVYTCDHYHSTTESVSWNQWDRKEWDDFNDPRKPLTTTMKHVTGNIFQDMSPMFSVRFEFNNMREGASLYLWIHGNPRNLKEPTIDYPPWVLI